MLFKLLIDKTCNEEVTAKVHERTPLVDEIERLVLQNDVSDKIPGYDNDMIVMLPIKNIECFYIENDKTYAQCINNKRYLVKKRLYELSPLLPLDFEKINKSAIANWKHVDKLTIQLSGAVNVVFKSGYEDYISRRCFSELRKRYKL